MLEELELNWSERETDHKDFAELEVADTDLLYFEVFKRPKHGHYEFTVTDMKGRLIENAEPYDTKREAKEEANRLFVEKMESALNAIREFI